MWQRRTVQRFFVPAICGLLGFLFSLRQYLLMLQKSEPITWSQAFFDQIPYWLLWAIISPLILWLDRRFPLQRQHWLRNLLVHIPASAVIGIVHPVLYLFASLWLNGRQSGQTAPLDGEMFRLILVFSLIPGIVFYWMILAISYAFNYYRQYQDERISTSQLRAQLAEARLHALKMQLHPHFLFNTLHSVTALVLKKDDRQAVRMINRLSALLRRTLDDADTQEVTLKQELEVLEIYLEIERIRFADRLTVEMHIDPQALNAQVPSWILQPLVENAVRHGIAPHCSASRIEIHAQRQNEKLRLEVRDDGQGLPENWAEDLQKGNLQKGIGLTNTRSRLAQLYGESYDFHLYNNEDGGASVTIDLPFRAKVEEYGNGSRQIEAAD